MIPLLPSLTLICFFCPFSSFFSFFSPSIATDYFFSFSTVSSFRLVCFIFTLDFVIYVFTRISFVITFFSSYFPFIIILPFSPKICTSFYISLSSFFFSFILSVQLFVSAWRLHLFFFGYTFFPRSIDFLFLFLFFF